jgi:hypothetical protein
MQTNHLRTDLHVNLVSTKHNGDILADTFEIAVPIWHILVCDSRRDVEHDNATLALDVISIAEPTKFFLTRSIPDIKANGAEIGGELEWVNFDTQGG